MDIITLAMANKTAKNYADSKLDAVSTNMDYKGSVASVSDLPSGATTGDVYTVQGERYVYDGTDWVKISSGSVTVDSELSTSSENPVQNKIITENLNEKATVDGVYPKLIAGGIIESEVKDEEFTYQQTEHTGIANLNSIKGNTLVWNQLIPIPSSNASTTVNDVTITDNRDGSFTLNGTASADGNFVIASNVPTPIGHKFLIKGYVKVGSNTGFMGFAGLNTDSGSGGIWTNNLTYSQLNARIEIKSGDTFNNTKMIPQYFDLTAMFGSGNEPTIEEFKSLYSLNYYAHGQYLLNFNGSGIKTTGKNLLEKSVVAYNTLYNAPLSDYFFIRKGTYTFSYTANTANRYLIKMVDASGNYLSDDVHKPVSDVYWNATYQGWIVGSDRPSGYYSTTVSIVEDCYIRFARSFTNNPDTIVFTDCQLEFGSSATSYEPYTTSTLSLPISTYFPTGMKSAGSVYDELTPTKAITRIGAVDLGTLTWTYYADKKLYLAVFDLKNPSADTEKGGLTCEKYVTSSYNAIYNNLTLDKMISTRSVNAVTVGFAIRDLSYDNDVQGLTTSLDGVYCNYALPTESSVDVDLDLTYRTYEGGTEQLLPINTDEPTTSPIKVNVEFDFDENLNARIEKMLGCLAQVETSPTTHAYSTGDYLMYNYQLYKVTSSISVGGTLTVGTNITATTVMSELLSLTA